MAKVKATESTRDKFVSIARGAAIAGAGAALVYVGAEISDAGLGVYGPLLAAACAAGVNALRKMFPDVFAKIGL